MASLWAGQPVRGSVTDRKVICGIELGGFYEDGMGQVWEVAVICEHPTMSLENVKTGQRVGGAIGAPIFDGFVKLVPEAKA